jgi:hypothetical protein
MAEENDTNWVLNSRSGEGSISKVPPEFLFEEKIHPTC